MSILAHFLFGGGADKDADISALIKEGALVVDTRTAGEYAGEHIEGAINIPFRRFPGSAANACRAATGLRASHART